MMTLERDPCSKIILAGIIFVGIYHALDTNVRINTQWENWAEGTPGHSDRSQGK